MEKSKDFIQKAFTIIFLAGCTEVAVDEDILETAAETIETVADNSTQTTAQEEPAAEEKDKNSAKETDGQRKK